MPGAQDKKPRSPARLPQAKASAQNPVRNPFGAPAQARAPLAKPKLPSRARTTKAARTQAQPKARTRPATQPDRPTSVQEAPPKPKKKEPTTIEELIPRLIKAAVRQESGLNVGEFDAQFMPRIKALVPESLERMAAEVINEYLVDIGHALYIAIVIGKFAQRPVLCGVRAAELAADLTERVHNAVQGKEDKRLTAIRCANLLVGLTLYSVRLIESTSLEGESLAGFTDNFERAVITTYGLKTQAEATGQAPWVGLKRNPLERRIGAAINHISIIFGDYIGTHAATMDEAQYDVLLGEFDSFMERFAPYIEGGRSSVEERRKKIEQSGRSTRIGSASVEPLEIKSLRTRPAGVEIELTDGRNLFVSTEDAKRIGSAADEEVDDTTARDLKELRKRQKDKQED